MFFTEEDTKLIIRGLKTIADAQSVCPTEATKHDAERIGTLIDYFESMQAPPAYDPNFGDDRLCKCGHTYYRHFDTYEDMAPVGCKYCGGMTCDRFHDSGQTESYES